MESKNVYTTDINELKVKDFFVFQKALLTLTIGENFNDLESIIIKTLSLLAKNKVADAHHELVSILTVIDNVLTHNFAKDDKTNMMLDYKTEYMM